MNTLTSSLGRTTQVLLTMGLVLGSFTASTVALPTQLLASINLEEYDTLVAPEPSTADDFYNRGLFFQGEGNLDGALDQFNQAIALSPSNADFYFSRGLTYTDMGDHQQALNDYSQALKIDQTFAAAYYQRGLSRIVIPLAGVTNFDSPHLEAEKQADVQLAINDFSQALNHSPDFVAAYYYRGLSNYVLGNRFLAQQDYQRAKGLNPMIAEAFYNQGFKQLYIGGDSDRNQ